MAESGLYMHCEEEDLSPCQNIAEETNKVGISCGAQGGYVAVSPAPPAGSPAASPSPVPTVHPAAGGLMKTWSLMPISTGPVVPRQLLPNVLQSIQLVPGGTPGQSVYISSQTPRVTHYNFRNPVRYILPAAFLTTAQAGQFITSQLASLSSTPKAAAPGNYTVRIPINLTIRSPSDVKNITTAASSQMSALSLSPLNLPPVSSPADSGQVATPPPIVPPLAATEVMNAEPPEVVTVPAAVSNYTDSESVPNHDAPAAASTLKVPAAVLTHNVSAASSTPSVPAAVFTKTTSQNFPQNIPVLGPKPQAENSAPQPNISKVFQGASRPPQTCSVCGSPYKVVQSLRGYLCKCNQELIRNIQALSVQTKRRKTRPVSHRSPTVPTSSSSFSYGRHQSASPPSASLKHITTSEIPEGAPSPGTGDYDQHGKLIILVEDFFYGKDPGQPDMVENNQVPIRMKCHLCDKKLKNNIKLMNHMKHHMEMELQRGDVECHNVCQHCFRNFSTPFTLQCHVETVHSQIESTALCKICELSFENEPLFLSHMKNIHKPGEMPYTCQVCNFRSSFYQDVVNHFRELHKDTNNLQCTYCLKVFKSSNSYQLHYSKHRKKSVQHCDKCRLQFLYSKEKADHKEFFHCTHLKPVQLLGLKPGTRVTIRAYTVNKVDDNSRTNAKNPSPKEISPAPAPSVPVPQCISQKLTPTKRKPVESMLELMTKFQSQCEPASKRICIECNYDIPDFSSHFPTFVHCSLCRYRTCCSRAYANHMISYHVSRKTTAKYLNLYKPCPKSGQLRCCSCDYTTEIGDSMAKHLVGHPGHCSSLCKFNEGFSHGYRRFVYIPSDLIRPNQRPDTWNLKNLHVMQVDQHLLSKLRNPATHPTQYINLPVGTADTPSISIQLQTVDQTTVPDETCGTESKDSSPQNRGLSTRARAQAQAQERSLSSSQLKVVLHALCFGVPQASNHFDTPPDEVQSLLLKRQLQLGSSERKEGLIHQVTDQLAEWVLCQREQQLPVNEGKLFSKASEIISKDGLHGISYEWAVDFLLQYNLGVQALPISNQLLPLKVQEHGRCFARFMTKQITTQGFGQSFIGAMDELSIFIDMDQLDPASADSSSMMSAFKLVGESDPLMDIVLLGLADGMMLPTMVFLKGEPLSADAPSLPDIVVLEAKPQGFSDEERLQLWFEKVWHRHVNPSSGQKALLVLDTYRGHVTDDFLVSLNSASTLPAMIPRACSHHLQPLEACVGPVLREFLQARWSQHVTETPQDLIGAEPADLALLFSAWLIEMLDAIAAKPELLQRSFDKVLSSIHMSPAELSSLVCNLTETLITSTLQVQEAEELCEKSNTLDTTTSSHLPSPPANSQALKKIFEKHSDLKSFIDFEDTETTDC